MDIELDLLTVLLIQKLRKKKRNGRWSVRLENRSRQKLGFFEVMLLNIKNNDPEQFFKYTRMIVQSFEYLLSLIKDELQKSSGKAISPEMRLAITLLYLSQGDSIQSIAWCYHIGKSTARKIVLETCSVVYRKLEPMYLGQLSVDDWRKIEAGFAQKWNMPNCIGAIDGKHIGIVCPPGAGSEFYNYKKFHSIILMAVCDAEYKFTMVEVGACASQSDGGVLRNSGFGKKILSQTLNSPNNKVLPNTSVSFPHYFVADAAFPLMENLMRPFPGLRLANERRIFNYRLSRARRTIENAFGILAARWRVLLKTIHVTPECVSPVVLVTICLHNFVIDRNSPSFFQYCPPNYADVCLTNGEIIQGQWREEIAPLTPVRRTGSNRSKAAAYNLRNKLTDYFNNIGSVPWQKNVLQA